MRSVKTSMRSFRTMTAVLLLLGVAVGARAAGDAKDPESTPQAKAYRTLLKSIETGDYEAYKKSMIASAGKELDAQIKSAGKSPKETMAFLKKMVPTGVKITSLKVDGKKATLEVTGKRGTEALSGTVDLAEENGEWKVNEQAWMSK